MRALFVACTSSFALVVAAACLRTPVEPPSNSDQQGNLDELPDLHDNDDPLNEPITFSRDIAPLLQQHCQSCHRDGGVGPFPLMTYADAAAVADEMKSAVLSGRMPQGPTIRLDTDCSDEDMFDGPRRLTRTEIDTIAGWVDAGAPEGNPADLPQPVDFGSDGQWKSGEPDLIFANDDAGFGLPTELGRDVFRRFVIPTDFDADRFITGFEALPGVAGGSGLDHFVHHVTLFIDGGRGSIDQLAQFQASSPSLPGPGFEGDFTYPVALVGMWFPGSAPLAVPQGLGLRLPAGACIVMEVHYGKADEEAVDKTLVGVHFADGPVEELQTSLVKTEDILLPAGAPDVRIEATRRFSTAFTLYSITPHMHQLGTDFRVSVELPDGTDICVADVAWDFEHQGTHRLRVPLELPAGAVIRNVCVYDNSSSNPNQFNDPPQDILFGRITDREMCQLTIATTGVPPPAPPPPPPPPPGEGLLLINEVLADPPSDFDANGDGAPHFQQDEFVELLNIGDGDLDLSGATISDEVGLRVTLPTELVLAPGEALVVFGGGTPAAMSGARVVAVAPLMLNNDGDTITVSSAGGAILASAGWGEEGGQDTSLVRAVEEDPAAAFVAHSQISAQPASPGRRANGDAL